MRDKAMSFRSYELDSELDPEQARVERPELSATTSDVVEAPVVELPSMHSQVEVKVENPISYANALQRSLKIEEGGEKPLHIAALAKQTAFVRKLVECLNKGDLELPNNEGQTAFFVAAISGVVEIAKAEERMNILVATIYSGMYDIALNILKADRSIVTSPNVDKGRALHALARKPFSYYGTSQEWICESVARFVPYVPYAQNNNSIFHLAVTRLQEKVFCLIDHTGAIKDLLMIFRDKSGNNILHLATKLAPSSRLDSVSGVALQKQRELLWFKMKNIDDRTPKELFTKQHKKLWEASEKWMKDTATSCMVVATLIATVVFVVAFTIPSGNKEETSAPIFLSNGWFTIFITSDAVTMFSSTASIMKFFTLFASIVCMVMDFPNPLNNLSIKVYVLTG
ncbi:Hypothetical predicted protein [Olea europaea subsp. europaea]|uniref:PGG domain-containing protein n=1 Tax=Olea europaea subsp. europaea TaxID=158383 RepID=A0A8S0Q2T1_OLEEU|nr:Hypothetical predicted protein [Olea europaea subsp. europaea]